MIAAVELTVTYMHRHLGFPWKKSVPRKPSKERKPPETSGCTGCRGRCTKKVAVK